MITKHRFALHLIHRTLARTDGAAAGAQAGQHPERAGDGPQQAVLRLQVLKQANILSTPVTGPNNQFCGVFSVTDVLKALVKALKLEKARSSFDMRADDAARALLKIYQGTVAAVMHPGDLWYIEGQDATVLDAVRDMLQRRQVGRRTVAG